MFLQLKQEKMLYRQKLEKAVRKFILSIEKSPMYRTGQLLSLVDLINLALDLDSNCDQIEF